ncbi:hypothetical protein [Paraburkholderia pallida]|uniref:Uncharacterized protein n=1 Tax=Paraburkholderia pallida TaxID=2547399 RepID=A0A4P7CVF0_9BURK|nr:hypothetical protein [Paraburkholderia pallida]QBQ98179.1 hypothetical protein E1956_14010 [Paraburkholderia pallida]
MAGFEIKSNIADSLGFMGTLFYNQIPYATARALTKTAQLAQQAIRAEMEARFDRPTPYTLNSTYVKSATKTDLVARVWIKDDTSKGTPASKYIGPEVYGGERSMKRFERALQARGLLPPGMVAVPGKAATLDQYGNVSRGLIVEVLSYLQAFGEQGYRANMSERRRDRMVRGGKGARGYSYFVLLKREGKLLPGIYKRIAYGRDSRIEHLAYSAAKPVFIFVKQPTYKPRLPFDDVARRVAEAQFEGVFRRAFEEAVETAR